MSMLCVSCIVKCPTRASCSAACWDVSVLCESWILKCHTRALCMQRQLLRYVTALWKLHSEVHHMHSCIGKCPTRLSCSATWDASVLVRIAFWSAPQELHVCNATCWDATVLCESCIVKCPTRASCTATCWAMSMVLCKLHCEVPYMQELHAVPLCKMCQYFARVVLWSAPEEFQAVPCAKTSQCSVYCEVPLAEMCQYFMKVAFWSAPLARASSSATC